MRRNPVILVVLGAALAIASVGFAVPAAEVAEEGTHSDNMQHIARILYNPNGNPNSPQGGSDIEFVTLELTVAPDGTTLDDPETREFAIAGAYANGLHIVDITDPENPVKYTYDCATAQSDIQVFTRADMPGRTLVAVTADDPYNAETRTTSRCYQEAWTAGTVKYGTMIVDISNPYDPVAIAHVPVVRGSHNQTVHPSGMYLYNSSSDVAEARVPGIDIFDITDLSAPQLVKTLDQDDRVVGLDSHDITFSTDGNRAYSAAVTETLVLDTTDPGDPVVIGNIIDPAIQIHHQSDPITMTDNTTGLERTFLIVTDEIAGAAGNGFCPGGGLHVYDITGPLEMAPVKVGFWEIPSLKKTAGALTRCTSHVLRLYPEQQLMTIAWYSAGVRVVDISGLTGISVGVAEADGNVGVGMRELGYYWFDNSDTWSVKTNRFFTDDEGELSHFYLYGNDQRRGFDVYRFDATASPSPDPGRWLSPEQALAESISQPRVELTTYQLSCFLARGD